MWHEHNTVSMATHFESSHPPPLCFHAAFECMIIMKSWKVCAKHLFLRQTELTEGGHASDRAQKEAESVKVCLDTGLLLNSSGIQKIGTIESLFHIRSFYGPNRIN